MSESNEQDLKSWWDGYTAHYQEDCQIPIDIIYGPGAPNEDQLQLMGDLSDRDVLEVGCGGAQASIAMAKRGARVTAMDLSDSQLEYARALAAQEGVQILTVQHDIQDLEPIESASQDLVFSAFAYQWIPDKQSAFQEVARVLRPGGLFVLSMDHPFFSKVEPRSHKVALSYHATGAVQDDRGEYGVVTKYIASVSELHNAITDAGLKIEKMIEPDSRERYAHDPWYGKRGAYYPEILALLPPTIIFKARKEL